MAKNTVTEWYGVIFIEINSISLLIIGNIHPNHLGLYRCIYTNPVSEKIVSYFIIKLQAALFVVRPHADKMPASNEKHKESGWG